MWQVKSCHGRARACPVGHGLWASLAAVLFASVPTLLLGPPAAAEPKPLNAEVVWVRANRAHIASTDSIPVEVGDLLEFQVRGKTKAAGTVAEIHEAGLVTARITSGSLDREKKLRDVRVRAEAAPLPRITTLRVGVPAPARRCALLGCSTYWEQYSWNAPHGYRPAPLAGTRIPGFVRVDSIALRPEWPDTMVLVLFDDAMDQEIGVERGDVDLAVFWPGEPFQDRPPRRGDWHNLVFGTRQRGVVARIQFAGGGNLASPPPGPNTVSDSVLAVLNREVFSGDLLPLSGEWPQGAQYRAFPLGGPMDAALARGTANAKNVERETGILSYLDARIDQPESLRVEARARLLLLPPEIRRSAERGDPIVVTPLFRLRYPILTKPPTNRLIRALGPDTFAEMLDCRWVYTLR